MPVLHLKVVPAVKGITSFNIHQPIKAQEIILRNVSVVCNSIGGGGDSIKLYIPFLAGKEINTTDFNSYLTVPLDPSTKWTSIPFNIRLGNEHISETFNTILLDDSNSPITGTSNIKQVHLYFEYKTNSLFH